MRGRILNVRLYVCVLRCVSECVNMYAACAERHS